MNCFISLRAIKPMLVVTGTTITIAANCGRTNVNRRVCLFLTKPYANYHNFVSKSRLVGGWTSTPMKLIATVSQRAVSNNTPAIPPFKKHDHTHVWVWERVIAAALLGIIPFFIAEPSDAVEYAAALVVTAHSHWGLEAICTDYLRPAVVGNFIPKCIPFIVFVPMVLLLYGIVNSIMSDRGIAHVLAQFWHLKTTQQLKSEQNAS